MKKVILSVFVIISCMASSCKKYDDGPAISLRSKSERIANNWRVEKAIDNGNDVSGNFDRYDVSFTKSGDASLTAQYSFLGIEYNYTTTGKWRFESDTEKLVVDYEDNSADATYFILRLKEKELWVRQENTNLELHLVPN